MQNEFRHIVTLVEDFLGSPKGEVNIGGWTEYNCPQCADFDGVKSDEKFNLCINYSAGYFHCWKCLDKGRLSTLIRKYGGYEAASEYYKEVKALKKSRECNVIKYRDITTDIRTYSVDINLPKSYQKLTREDKYTEKAYEYLEKRGIDDSLIELFNIGYIGYVSNPQDPDYKLRNRIIIPSYGAYNKLNYWVARDFSGKTKLKYINPDVEKSYIVFNENLINWYEDVTLVEGVFDHMVIPNSIPLLGKVLKKDSAVFSSITENAKANVNILLDDDAYEDAFKMYKLLLHSTLEKRIRIIICPDGFDASLIYEKYGKKGIINLMRSDFTPSDSVLNGVNKDIYRKTH